MKLNYFVGKVCTILTSSTSRFFNETEHVNVFLGLVEEIDELGIWVLQLGEERHGKKSFFTHRSLVGIIEEVVKLLDDEEIKKVVKKLESNIAPKNEQQLISLENIKNIKKNNQLGKK